MKLKLTRIAVKPFIFIFSLINVVAGLVLGLIVTVVSLVAPDPQSGGIGALAILIFPILNGLLGVVSGLFLAGMYNWLAPLVGGAVFEFEDIKE